VRGGTRRVLSAVSTRSAAARRKSETTFEVDGKGSRRTLRAYRKKNQNEAGPAENGTNRRITTGLEGD